MDYNMFKRALETGCYWAIYKTIYPFDLYESSSGFSILENWDNYN